MKKLFGKRGIALLTTLALVISMVAMLGGLTASAAEYTPKRVMTFETSEGIQQSCWMLTHAFEIPNASGKTVTVAGYYKVDSITGTKWDIAGTSYVETEPTDGWVAFSFEYAVPAAEEWKNFGFWEAYGVFSLADITFTDAEGNVLYDMATDEALVAGEHKYDAGKKIERMGIGYVMGANGTVAEGAECTVTIDPVYEAPVYTPKRVMTFETSEGIQQSCWMLTHAFEIPNASGKTVTVAGYYKVDSITGTKWDIAGTSYVETEPTDGWVAFSFEYAVPAAEEWKNFGFWEAYGVFSLADITFTDAEGNVLYDMATDEALVAGEHKYDAGKKIERMGIGYVMGANGTVAEGAECTVTIDPVYTSPVYTPERTMSVSATVDSLDAGAFQAAFMLAKVGEFFGYSTEYTVKGYYKVADFVSVDASSKATLGAAGVEQVAEWTAFETTYTSNASGEAWSDYGFWNAGGTLYLADIVLEKDGVVVYDMATDVNLVAGEYTTAQTMGIWYLGKWGAGTGSFKFVIDEAVETEDPCANGHNYVGGVCERCGDEKEYPVIEGDTTYQPKRVMSVQTWGGANGAAGTAIEGKLMFTKAGTYFPDHNIVVVKGYYKIENYKEAVNGSGKCVQIGAGNRANGEETQSPAGNTNGWVEFSVSYRPKDYGEPDWNQALKFGFWYTHGKLSLADITVESTTGEVLYDMAYDEELIAGTYAGPALQEGGDDVRQMGLWWIGTYGYDDWADVEIVIDEALEKPVTPPAQTGDVNMIVVVALGAMAAMTLAVVTLNKKKFSV